MIGSLDALGTVATQDRPIASPARTGTAFAYKWLRSGAFDPDDGYAWEADEGSRTEKARYGLVYAFGPAGLPFGVDDELWVVEVRDLIGIKPSPEQRQHGGPRVFCVPERSLIARAGRLIRRVDAWTPDLAARFAEECARRTRQRVLDALEDASRMLREDGGSVTVVGWRDAIDRGAPRLDPGVEGSVAFRLVESLIGIWQDARAMAVRGDQHPADVYATAAAASRAAAALTYGSVASSRSDGCRSADRAYAEERRWQARWLAGALGIPRHVGGTGHPAERAILAERRSDGHQALEGASALQSGPGEADRRGGEAGTPRLRTRSGDGTPDPTRG